MGNAWFQQPTRRKWTRESPGDGNKNQMDYILISKTKRFRNAFLSAKTYTRTDFDSDHVPDDAKY